MAKFHEPVLREKVFQYLVVKEEGIVVDGTLGDGGHTEFILQNTGPRLRVLGIDRDANALLRAKKRLAPFGDRVAFAHGNYSEIQSLLKKFNVEKIDGFQKFCGGDFLGKVHPHVQRTVPHEGESTFRGIDLRAGDSEVQQESINFFDIKFF